MKSVFCLFVIANLALVYGQGFPTRNCPPGEHSVLYCPQMAEPSCDNPTVHDMDAPGPCDIPQCFCDTPNVRNTKNGQCIPVKMCPK